MVLKPQYSAQISLGHRKVDLLARRNTCISAGLATNPSGGQDSPVLLEYLGIKHLNLALMILPSISLIYSFPSIQNAPLICTALPPFSVAVDACSLAGCRRLDKLIFVGLAARQITRRRHPSSYRATTQAFEAPWLRELSPKGRNYCSSLYRKLEINTMTRSAVTASHPDAQRTHSRPG